MDEPESRRNLMTNRNMTTQSAMSKMNKRKLDAQWFKAQLKKPQNIFNGLIIIIATLVITLGEYGYIPSTKVGFFCNDPLFSYKYDGEIITPEILGVIVTIPPLIIVLLTEYLTVGSWRNWDLYRIYYLIRELLVGGVFTLFITEIGKLIIGEHRPHFFDVCRPDAAENCTTGSFISDYHCTSTEFGGYFLVDSSRSFPSGHSSVSAFVALFSSYLVHSRLPTEKTGSLMRPFLISVCLTSYLLCALTRITDRRHHWWDVLAGSIIGGLIALYFIITVDKNLKSIDEEFEERTDSVLLNARNRTETENVV